MDFTTDNRGIAKTEGYRGDPYELFDSGQKNRGGFPPLFLFAFWTDNYESAIVAIVTDSAANQANAVLKWLSELSVT